MHEQILRKSYKEILIRFYKIITYYKSKNLFQWAISRKHDKKIKNSNLETREGSI
jgi:hypothetical protein